MPKRKDETLFGGESVTIDDREYRQELFKAICDACSIDIEKLTPGGRGSLNKAVREIAAVDATAAEVEKVATGFRRHWPNVKLTPTAISSKWAMLVHEQPKYTTQPGVSTKPELEEFDQNLENIKIVERSHRVAELGEARRTQLTRDALAAATSFVADRMRRNPDAMNVAICRLLDEGDAKCE